MKRDVIGRILPIIIMSIFLLSGILAVDEGTCGIVTSANCDDTVTEGYIVMGLSAITNAHGEFPYDAYSYVLCCNFGYGTTTCSGTNKIIGLSSSTNAHAEIPSEDNYGTDVCYEDLECTHKSSCSEEELGVLSLSATTNAHIGEIDDYSVKICCSSSLAAGCSLNSAQWSVEEAQEGQRVYLQVTGNDRCNAQSVSFEVWEDDEGSATTNPSNVAFSGNMATGVWYAEWMDDGLLQGDPEYYFTATLVSDPQTTIDSSNELSVSEWEGDCIDVSTCEDYTTENDCISDAGLCSVADDSGAGIVECSDDEIICECFWDETECVFGYTEINEEDCGDAMTGCNYGCTLCDNPTTGPYCAVGNTCPSGETPGNNNETCDFGIDGCSSDDCSDGEQDTCSSGTYCMAGKCSSVEGPSVSFGNCKISQEIKTSCEEGGGVKTIEITTKWEGDTSEVGYQKCMDLNGKTIDVSCPAQIQLPFFDYIEMIITSIIIAGVYILLILKSKLKKVKKGKRK